MDNIVDNVMDPQVPIGYNAENVSDTSLRSRISALEERIEHLKQRVEECKASGCELDDFVDDLQEIDELKEQLNFAWQDDEAEYNYAVQQQEFNPDGSLVHY